MVNNTSKIISAKVTHQDPYHENRIAKKNRQILTSKDNQCLHQSVEPEDSSVTELTDDEKIDIVAARILKRFKLAFEELAK